MGNEFELSYLLIFSTQFKFTSCSFSALQKLLNAGDLQSITIRNFAILLNINFSNSLAIFLPFSIRLCNLSATSRKS